MENSWILETQGLTKVFGDKVAVSNLTLRVAPGEVFGFLGPNGAGKTTAVKMLLGLISPTSGSGSVMGAPLGDVRTRRQIGFLPEHFRFHEWLTANEFLKLHADLYQIPSAQSQRRISELLNLVGLTQHANKKLHDFSKGMLQRIGLAQALLNNPGLVILDEPTSGLDPLGRLLVRDIIRDLRDQGATVFLNSHLLGEVEITCDRVAFIKQGDVVRVSSLKTLMEGEITLEIRAYPLDSALVSGLSPWGRDIRLDGDRLTLTVACEADLPLINKYLVERGVSVFAFRPQQLSLEELFIQTVGTDGDL